MMDTLQKWMIAAIFVSVGMAIIGIWTNDWRWIATGMVVGLPAACVAIGRAL